MKMRHISRSTKAATAVAAVALTVLAGTGVAMAAGPGAATATTMNARSASGQPTPGLTPAAPTVDAPTRGDVRDVAKADAETADGARDTDKIQQGDRMTPETAREAPATSTR